MKITITIKDHDSGNVQIDSNPDISKLIEVARSGIQITPAETYAMIALRRLIEYSGELAKEKSGLPGAPRTKLL